MNDETDIVATLLRRAQDGDEVSGVAAAEIRRLRGIAGRDARITKQSRDLLAGRRALNPKMKIRTHGLHRTDKAARVTPPGGCRFPVSRMQQNTQDQRLATADETTPADGIASPLHPLVLKCES